MDTIRGIVQHCEHRPVSAGRQSANGIYHPLGHRNYATDATSVTVLAYLQSGTTFIGAATSTGLASTSLPTYNAETGEIIWTIPFSRRR